MSSQATSTQCRHERCRCTVEPSLAYCCEYCARADQQPAGEESREACDCGHPECQSDPRPPAGR